MIVRSVRVGIPVQEAVRTVARELPHPTGPEFSRVVSQVLVGVASRVSRTATRPGSVDSRPGAKGGRAGRQPDRFDELIASLGQLILRSGIVSASTRAELENTSASSGP